MVAGGQWLGGSGYDIPFVSGVDISTILEQVLHGSHSVEAGGKV